MNNKSINRRDFLKLAGMVGGSAFLAACGKTLSTTVPAATQVAGGAAVTKPATISFMGWGAIEEDEAVRAAIAAFKEIEPAIEVTWMHTPDSYNEKLLSLVAAKTPPDTAFVSASDYQTFAKEGLLADITDMLKSDPVIGAKGYFFEPQEEQRCAWDGRWYGIGSCWVADHLYYNADLFTEAGIKPPSNDPAKIWDWETFKEVARQLTIDKSGKHPGDAGFDPDNIERFGCEISNYRLHQASFLRSNGANYFDPQTGLLGLDTPEAIWVMQELADLRLKYHIAPYAANLEQLGMDANQMLSSGKLAMLVDGSWALATLTKADMNLGTATLPKMKTPATGMNAHLHGILQGTKEPEASFKWLRYLATEFYQTIFLKIGLWLPSQTALTTPEGMKKWYTERTAPGKGIHPAGYDVLINKYFTQYGFPFYEPPGWPDVRALLFPEIEAIYNGNKTAEQVMKEFVPQCNDILSAAAG